ncbi:hypothetical protein MSHOH_2114 [Methanosarcina horonobensis HB-1 = JCM 15518]|uniref:Uncharacterized protein n=2 Tax=Methanosarcina horonobensis TaxID=418008 RepID=A0A0E3SEI5_9EURY|nr:permease prefix domain 1-containing protein [Methanosarcina horonobensis]AKB78597.1 hypothetical protein MSHOH_2114 [Methanosarcina horonobensis HB-1 = JCM 15518]
MDTQKYVDGLFSGYEETPALTDFKEELRSNLDDRIANLIKKGMSEQTAFAKATTELGDVSVLADEISFKKKKEVFSEVYLKTKNYMKLWQKIGYTLAGGLMALGIIISLLAYFASGDIVAGLGVLIVFFIVPVCGFVFLGLTQETARNIPMNWKRALIYVAAVGVILFGLVVFAILFFEENGVDRTLASIGSLIPFVLPGSVVLAFLLLTEKNRHKPWVVEQQAVWAERMKDQLADPYAASRFGLFSGALWIFAIALFAGLGFLIGFQYSWLVFLFAVSGQLLIQAFTTPKIEK